MLHNTRSGLPDRDSPGVQAPCKPAVGHTTDASERTVSGMREGEAARRHPGGGGGAAAAGGRPAGATLGSSRRRVPAVERSGGGHVVRWSCVIPERASSGTRAAASVLDLWASGGFAEHGVVTRVSLFTSLMRLSLCQLSSQHA